VQNIKSFKYHNENLFEDKLHRNELIKNLLENEITKLKSDYEFNNNCHVIVAKNQNIIGEKIRVIDDKLSRIIKENKFIMYNCFY
jgi:hypothetical protein